MDNAVAFNRVPRSVLKTSLLDKFSCLGPNCADNCCNTWTVRVDSATHVLYENKAPELLDFVSEKQGIGHVLQFDKETGCCPKLSQGSCKIHSAYGTDFLTDTCHLYPRITRELGKNTIVTATLSCPEIARLALIENESLGFVIAQADRTPEEIKQYLPNSIATDSACALIKSYTEIKSGESAEKHLARLAAEAQLLSAAELPNWPALHEKAKPLIDGVIPQAVPHENDPIFMLIILTTLVTACKIKPSTRLVEVVKIIEQALNIELLWEAATANTNSDSLTRYANLKNRYLNNYKNTLEPTLKRLLKAQINSSLYPYAGLGNNPYERITWIAYTYALIRLGLMCAADVSGGRLQEEVVIKIVQSLTRILDHVGTLELAVPMLNEAGWMNSSRLIGLIDINNI